MELIRTQALTKHYDGVVGLADLTVTIPTGTIALVGPNGPASRPFSVCSWAFWNRPPESPTSSVRT